MAQRRPPADRSPAVLPPAVLPPAVEHRPVAAPLFDVPPDHLGARLHDEVFGALPRSTARALDVPVVAAVVRPLLSAGWRPAQLAARVGALPAATDPVGSVVAFLTALRERDSPQHTWERERAARDVEQRQQREQVTGAASDESRADWAAEARRALGLPPRVLSVPPPRPRAPCASCGDAGDYFVTREVRLCTRCVEQLRSGSVSLGPRSRVS